MAESILNLKFLDVLIDEKLGVERKRESLRYITRDCDEIIN